MKRSAIVFLVLAAAAAAVCIRLGFWQLDRRAQRRAMNETIAARMKATPVPVASVDRDTANNRFSMVVVAGEPDYDHEVLLTHRGRDGAPGVDVLTPVRVPGLDSAVLVNRGWVYSPDGMTIERFRWRDSATVFTGYVNAFDAESPDTVRQGGIRRASHEAVARAIPYPILRFYVVALADSAVSDSAGVTPRIIRLRPPKLDDGPHLSYAFQWFGFAMIALAGAGIVTARTMRGRRP